MLELTDVCKTFNPGTVNDKDRAERRQPHAATTATLSP